MSINKDKIIINPFTGDLTPVPDVAVGITVRNTLLRDFTVPAGYTHLHGTTIVPDGTTITVEEDGEYIVL